MLTLPSWPAHGLQWDYSDLCRLFCWHSSEEHVGCGRGVSGCHLDFGGESEHKLWSREDAAVTGTSHLAIRQHNGLVWLGLYCLPKEVYFKVCVHAPHWNQDDCQKCLTWTVLNLTLKYEHRFFLTELFHYSDNSVPWSKQGSLPGTILILSAHASLSYAGTYLYTIPILRDPAITLFPLRHCCRLNQTCFNASPSLSFPLRSGNKEITVLSWRRADFLLSKHWCLGREIKL